MKNDMFLKFKKSVNKFLTMYISFKKIGYVSLFEINTQIGLLCIKLVNKKIYINTIKILYVQNG